MFAFEQEIGKLAKLDQSVYISNRLSFFDILGFTDTQKGAGLLETLRNLLTLQSICAWRDSSIPKLY